MPKTKAKTKTKARPSTNKSVGDGCKPCTPTKILMILIGVGLAVFFSLFFLAIRVDEGSAGEASDRSIFIPFVPVWIAVFIPLFAKKNGKKLSENFKKTLLALLVATIILVFITFLILVS